VSEAHKRRRKQAFSFTAAMSDASDSSDDGLDLMRTRRRDAKEDDKDLSSNGLGGDSEDDFYDSNAGEDGDNRADIDVHDTKKCKDMLDTQLNLATPEFPQKIELAKM
jgi:hypothetical protein